VYGSAAETTAGIQSIMVRCDDCHVFSEEMAGPHGAAVGVLIDPEYSQTEYANPTPLASQWAATGTDRVICMKCHPLEWDYETSPTVTPKANPVHARHFYYSHRYHGDYDPNDPAHGDEEIYHGANCIDCHVRVPHAWKRPRLLTRTMEASGAVDPSPDEWPYVFSDHWGLQGIVLEDHDGAERMSSGSCAVGDCYGSDVREYSGHPSHPRPSMMPTGTVIWP
jgi:hypothetical protein